MDLPKRKNVRLKDYDYSENGAYFITICSLDKQNIFSVINVGTTTGRPNILSDYGIIIENNINNIPKIYIGATIDKYVIMPNHIHFIIRIENDIEGGRPMVVPTISKIIQQFKGSVTKKIGTTIWQTRFYDHIIRNETEYQEIWKYIDENPIKWQEDKYYIR